MDKKWWNGYWTDNNNECTILSGKCNCLTQSIDWKSGWIIGSTLTNQLLMGILKAEIVLITNKAPISWAKLSIGGDCLLK